MKEFILALAGVYVLILIVAYLFQGRLVYFPDRMMVGSPGDAGLEFEDVWLRSGSKRIHGWFIPVEAPRATVLFFHGNAGNISHRLDSIKLFHDLQLSVLIIDYQGYGRSEGKPGERATGQDARAAWDYLTEERGLRPDDIVLFGRSLGGAVAIELATVTDPLALIVESCFTSVADMGAKAYPWLPIRLVRRIHYNSLHRVEEIDVPKLFIHSIDDEVVPFGMGKRLYGRAQPPKQFLKIRGGHQDGFIISGKLYTDALAEFLQSVQETKGRAR